jgi:hypothetical protein
MMRIKPLLFLFLLIFACQGCNTRHKAKVMKLRNHHILLQDDQGRWFRYMIRNLDIDFDVPVSASGKIELPTGGTWVSAKPLLQEEEEAEAVIEEETTVAETDAGEPDGGGDVGGGDSGADGGGDAGGGDGD